MMELGIISRMRKEEAERDVRSAKKLFLFL